MQKIMFYEMTYRSVLSMLKSMPAVEDDRTGTGTRRTFGLQLRADLRDGLPLIQSKTVHFKSVVEELLWFLRGETNIQSLQDAGVKIWNEWATPEGELGPVYGAMWRSWPTTSGDAIDQIKQVIEELKAAPTSRRLVVSAWNPEFLPDTSKSPNANAAEGKQALPPCHALFQFFAQRATDAERFQYAKVHGLAEDQAPEYFLDLQLYQRSADWFLGVPFNVASYSLLLMMVAHHVGMVPRHFIHTFGDVHLYANHIEAASELLSREVKPGLPQVRLNYDPALPLESITASQIELVNYNPQGVIRAPISV